MGIGILPRWVLYGRTELPIECATVTTFLSCRLLTVKLSEIFDSKKVECYAYLIYSILDFKREKYPSHSYKS